MEIRRIEQWQTACLVQAYVYLFDLISLPDAIHSDTSAIVSWVAQTFLQLVLFSVIMVGQDVRAVAADKRGGDLHDVSATLQGNLGA